MIWRRLEPVITAHDRFELKFKSTIFKFFFVPDGTKPLPVPMSSWFMTSIDVPRPQSFT